MNVEEFEKRAKSIVEDELKNIKTIVKKIPDPKAKDEVDRLGLDTIDVDIKKNPLAFNVLNKFVANLILEQLKDKSENIDYEQIIKDIVSHIMTFCVGYKAALRCVVVPNATTPLNWGHSDWDLWKLRPVYPTSFESEILVLSIVVPLLTIAGPYSNAIVRSRLVWIS
jgi:hypothetical protein